MDFLQLSIAVAVLFLFWWAVYVAPQSSLFRGRWNIWNVEDDDVKRNPYVPHVCTRESQLVPESTKPSAPSLCETEGSYVQLFT
jgi:hypothetical protein